MKIQIRPAAQGDLDKIEELYGALCDFFVGRMDSPRWSRGVYPLREHAEAELEAKTLYVAEVETEEKGKIRKQIAGSVSYQRRQGEVYRKVEWQVPFDVSVFVIHILAVHPKFMRYGIGTALLEYASELGRKQGVRAVRLDVFEENSPAICLYERCGFVCRGVVDLGLEEIYGLKWYKVYEKLIEQDVAHTAELAISEETCCVLP